MHGQPRRKGERIVVPMYHPAAALHQGSLRRVIETDFSRLPGFLEKVLAGETPVAERTEVPAHLKKGAAPAPSTTGTTATEATTEAAPDAQQMRLL